MINYFYSAQLENVDKEKNSHEVGLCLYGCVQLEKSGALQPHTRALSLIGAKWCILVHLIFKIP